MQSEKTASAWTPLWLTQWLFKSKADVAPRLGPRGQHLPQFPVNMQIAKSIAKLLMNNERIGVAGIPLSSYFPVDSKYRIKCIEHSSECMRDILLVTSGLSAFLLSFFFIISTKHKCISSMLNIYCKKSAKSIVNIWTLISFCTLNKCTLI